MIKLGDDGTLDTVLYCSECGKEMRYNFEPEWSEEGTQEAYDSFVLWATTDAQEQHECQQPEGAE